MDVYVSTEVAEVQALHPDVARPAFRQRSIRDQIRGQAATLSAGHRAGDRRIAMQVMSWWPGARGRSLQEVLGGPFSDEDARNTVSREYGFADWAEVEALGNRTPDARFEQALDHVLAGDVAQLRMALQAHPSLSSARSTYGHRATLLHYLGANGVESHRQVTPLLAVEIAELLLAHGADKAATAGMYGGGQTAHDLARTSAHPRDAGVAEALTAVLRP